MGVVLIKNGHGFKFSARNIVTEPPSRNPASANAYDLLVDGVHGGDVHCMSGGLLQTGRVHKIQH